jgi:beta-alanine degradation protein BauB
MKTSLKSLFIATTATLVAAASLVAFAASDNQPSVNVPVTKIQFGPTGVKDGKTGELLAGPVYGNLGKGPHGTFIRMPAGFVSPVHNHTGAYWGIVISGVAANGLPGAADVELPAGSYWYQKGGEAHVTKCLAGHECLFFISQDTPFDYVAVPKK